MRSIPELLKTYNFVNTPEGRKYTVKFFAGLFAIAVIGVGIFFMTSGPGPGDTRFAGDEPDDPLPPDDDEEGFLPEIITVPIVGGVYIGFAEDAASSATEEERLSALQAAVDAWLQDNPGRLLLDAERVPATGEGPIMGYVLRLGVPAPTLPVQT